jgi:hypothetical protein
MRTLVVSLLVIAAPAAAQTSQERFDAAGAVTIDIMEVTASGRGGVDPSAVAEASGAAVTAAYRCFGAVKPKPVRVNAMVTLKFRVDNHGAIATATAAGLPIANSCLATAMKAIVVNTPNKGAIDFTEKLSFRRDTAENVDSSAPQPTGGGPLPMYGGLQGDSINAKRGIVGIAVAIGEPTVEGDADHAILRRDLLRNQQQIRACYKQQLQNKPRLAGTVHARFTINADGKVVTSTATGVDGALTRCIAEAIQKIEFLRPKVTGVATAECPIELYPGDVIKP